MGLFEDAYKLSALFFLFLVYLVRSKRPNTPHENVFVFNCSVRNSQVRCKVFVMQTIVLHVLASNSADEINTKIPINRYQA